VKPQFEYVDLPSACADGEAITRLYEFTGRAREYNINVRREDVMAGRQEEKRTQRERQEAEFRKQKRLKKSEL
jgi:hypothetical protein